MGLASFNRMRLRLKRNEEMRPENIKKEEQKVIKNEQAEAYKKQLEEKAKEAFMAKQQEKEAGEEKPARRTRRK